MGAESLFPLRALYTDDPINPGIDDPTPPEIVAELTGSERAERVRNLIRQANLIVDQAVDSHLNGRNLVAQCVLFSGGNDSTVLAHLMRSRATHAIHCNTTIGIEQTRQFVRDTCAEWNLPLLEEVAPKSYRELVLESGFPGPAMHWKMYQRLKERGLRQAKRRLVADGRRERVLFIAGRRRLESDRRSDVPLHEWKDSVIWASPIALWSKLDMNTYRLMYVGTDDPVPVNEVSELLHMSGECLCGAFAKPNELDEIGAFFPEVRDYIEGLQREVRQIHGEPIDRWGHGSGARSKSGPMCSSCSYRQLDLFD